MGWFDEAIGWAGNLLGDVGKTVGNWLDVDDWGFFDADDWEKADDAFGLAPVADFNTLVGKRGLLGGGDWLAPAIKTGIGSYLERDAARREMERLRPLTEESQRFVDWSRGFYDPQRLGRAIAEEESRLTELATPLVEKAMYPSLYRDVASGQHPLGSTVGRQRAEERGRQVAGLLSSTIAPQARRNIYDLGQRQAEASKARLASLGGQPQYMTDPKTGAVGVSPLYSTGQQQWYKPLLSSYLN